jgi:hypothetical protein
MVKNPQLRQQTGPKKLCIDGTYGVNSTHFEVEEVDIFSNHYYPLNNALLQDDIAAVEKANRTYLAGEIDWRDQSGDSLASFYNVILAKQNSSSPVVAGSLFWSLFGHNVPDCSVGFDSVSVVSVADFEGNRNLWIIQTVSHCSMGIRIIRRRSIPRLE